MQRRRQGWALQHGRARILDVVDPQVFLLEQEVLSTRPANQIEGVPIGADHQVAAVVHVFARERVAVGRGPSAQDAPSLEQRHLVALLLEGDRGREPGEAGAEDDDLHRPQYTRGTVRRAIAALRGRDSRTTGRVKGWPRREISSSRLR